MDMLQRTLAPVRRQLGQLTTTHKLFIGAVLVILLMTLFIVAQYTGKTATEELLPGASAAEVDAADTFLAELGLKTERRANKLFIASADKQRAISRLAESNRLPNDKAILFENILQKPSWTNSRQQNDQLYNNALQNELGLRIADFKGIKVAKVFLDIPEMHGFGATVRKPSASATVTTDTGAPLSQEMVDAIAQFIAGSKAGLTIDRVRIIDAANGRQRKPTSEEDALPTIYLEQTARVEGQTRDKVQELLAYIPGVVVAVTAHVDVTRSRAEVRTNMPDKQGTVALRRKETESSTTSTEAAPGAEPGFGANQTADINKGGGGPTGSTLEKTDTTTEYENHVGTRTETIIDPRGHPTMVAVSVNVPRGFVAALIKPAADATKKDGATDKKDTGPTDDEVNARFAQMKKDIIESLIPHVRAMTAMANSAATPDEVKRMVADSIGVSLIPVDVPIYGGQQAGVLGALGAVMGGGGSCLLYTSPSPRD